jgi:hypothetical protein
MKRGRFSDIDDVISQFLMNIDERVQVLVGPKLQFPMDVRNVATH